MSEFLLEAETIYSEFGDDPDMAELVELFVDEAPQRVAALEESFAAGDWPRLGALAHQLKGALGSYGFEELTPYALALESAARRRRDPEEIRQALDAFARLCSKLQAGAPA